MSWRTEQISDSVTLHCGDCREILPTLDTDSFDACATDPPYELGFMGRAWDRSGVANDVAMWRAVLRVLKPGAHLLAFGGTRTRHRMVSAVEDAGFEIRDEVAWTYGQGFPKSKNLCGEWDGWGTALKPAWEPIIVARKPLSERSVEANVARWGTGALNIKGCRIAGVVQSPAGARAAWEIGGGDDGYVKGTGREYNNVGRWPANLIHDGSQGVLELFPETKSNGGGTSNTGFWSRDERGQQIAKGDSGSAARFFYCAKATASDRAGSEHPTVKPRALMRYLCRLVTPPGGTVLDPFAGSGTTLYAARDEGFGAVGIEQEAEYVAHVDARLAATPSPDPA